MDPAQVVFPADQARVDRIKRRRFVAKALRQREQFRVVEAIARLRIENSLSYFFQLRCDSPCSRPMKSPIRIGLPEPLQHWYTRCPGRALTASAVAMLSMIDGRTMVIARRVMPRIASCSPIHLVKVHVSFQPCRFASAMPSSVRRRSRSFRSRTRAFTRSIFRCSWPISASTS
jgi:hypothetical protein